MKHLRKFANIEEYNTAFIYEPSVSLISGDNGIMYDPLYIPDTVEIGGVKWATCNVGAKKPEETGLYFQWGDTQGYKANQVGSGGRHFNWDDYKWYGDGTSSNMTKYNSTDGKTVLDLSDDAANAAYGGNWRMPTSSEFQALGNVVNTVWTADYQGSGVAGLVCTDKEDSTKELFFPAAGHCDSGSVDDVGSGTTCWCSSLSAATNINAYNSYSSSSGVSWKRDGWRYVGCSVRGVLDDNN